MELYLFAVPVHDAFIRLGFSQVGQTAEGKLTLLITAIGVSGVSAELLVRPVTKALRHLVGHLAE